MNLTYILSIVGPMASIILSILAWYYKKDIDTSQKAISSLTSGMEELKALMRVHTTNYEHLLREVQSIALLANKNRDLISDQERRFTEKIQKIELEIERIKRDK